MREKPTSKRPAAKAGVSKKRPTKLMGGTATMPKAGVMKKRPVGLNAGSAAKKK